MEMATIALFPQPDNTFFLVLPFLVVAIGAVLGYKKVSGSVLKSCGVSPGFASILDRAVAASDLRLLLVAVTVFAHFTKRDLECLFVHKFSGHTNVGSLIFIAGSYATITTILLITQIRPMGRRKEPPSVQYPSPGPIQYNNLVWTQGQRRGTKDSSICTIMTAFILWGRMNDFMDGQTMEDGTNVEWAIEDSIKDEKELKRPQLSSSLIQTWFYCPYGPQDYRFNPKHKKSKKRGCLARFAIRQLKLYPHIGEVVYYHSEHTRENGDIAHGTLDPDSIARRSQVAPRISEELKNSITKRLDDGLMARQVFEEHVCTEPTQESMSIKMQQLLQRIHEESMAGGCMLMQHTNAILERLYTDVKYIRSSEAMESLHPHMHFEGRTDITSKSIKRTRDYMEVYLRRKKSKSQKKDIPSTSENP